MAARQSINTNRSTTRPTTLAGVSIRELPWAGLAALLSLGAAGLHFAVAPEHFEEYWLFGCFFVLSAWLQAAWAVAITSRPNRLLLVLGIVGNLALVGLWLYTRVVEVPLGPDAGSPEAFGRPDELTIVFELATAAIAAGLLVTGWHMLRRTTDWLVLIPGSAVMMVLIGWVLWK